MSSTTTTTNKSIESKINILLGITGSVASIKLTDLVIELNSRLNCNICIIPTKNALNFLAEPNVVFNQKKLEEKIEFIKKTSKSNSAPDLSVHCEVLVFNDEDEWSSWSKRGDPVLHIELKKWADLFLIAPLDANTLGKLSNGLCDNLLTCVARAWDLEQIKQRPIIICPAMNTFMYKHPITSRQLKMLKDEFGFVLVDSVEKTLMCGDSGVGAMASVKSIVDAVVAVITIS